MEDHRLQLADAKTVTVLLAKKRIPYIIPMLVEETEIMTKHAAKYLRLILNSELAYWKPIRRTAHMVAKVTRQGPRTMVHGHGRTRTPG